MLSLVKYTQRCNEWPIALIYLKKKKKKEKEIWCYEVSPRQRRYADFHRGPPLELLGRSALSFLFVSSCIFFPEIKSNVSREAEIQSRVATRDAFEVHLNVRCEQQPVSAGSRHDVDMRYSVRTDSQSPA